MTHALSFSRTVGNTPLIRLDTFSAETGCEILGKAEFLNPGGSVKDRAARAIVDDAERRGALRMGGTVVEGTAGNTGIGLAHVCNERGYRCVIVMPDNQSPEEAGAAGGPRRPGAPRQDGALFRPEPLSACRRAHRAGDRRGGLGRISSTIPSTRVAHFETTGPEIWAQTGGDIDAFVAATGTGGTLAGVSRYSSSRSAAEVIIALADPPGRQPVRIRDPRSAQGNRHEFDHRRHRHRSRDGESRQCQHR